MHIEISRDLLVEALGAVTGVVERRQTLPILGNVRIEAGEDTLTVIASDLELQLTARLPVSTLQPGKVTIPARKLFDICRGLPEGSSISLQVSDGRATLRSSKSRFSLSTLPADEYPLLETEAEVRTVGIAQGQLRRLIEKTQFAMASQDVRYYLNGLCLHLFDNQLRAVATDGHRLAVSECEVNGRFEDQQVLIPRKGVLELQRLLDDSDAEVALRLSENQVALDQDNISLVCKLIDGRFPDYQRVIPAAEGMLLQADREIVRRALQRAVILANEKYRGVRLLIEGSEMHLQTHNPEHEEADEVLEVEFDGESMDIGFNAAYLLDALGAIAGERFHLYLKAPDASGLVTDPDDLNSRYVVMPMRL